MPETNLTRMSWILWLGPLPLLISAYHKDAMIGSANFARPGELHFMLRHIATVCVTTVFLPALAWAQQASPVDDPNNPTVEEIAPVPLGEPASARSSKLPTAIDNLYAGASLGPVFFRDNSIGALDIDYDTGTQLTAFGGARLGLLRIEGEIASQYAEFDPSNSVFDGDFSVFRATANLYLDLGTYQAKWVKSITPYVGGGVGVAVADIEGFDDDDSGFTTHGEVGFSFPIQAKIELVPAYRFEWSDFDELDDNQKAHIVRVGARYNF